MENTQVGPFLVLSRLGNNRRQQVFRARQVEQDRDVALKFISLPPNVARDKALDKIEREVKFLQQLRHPNLLRLFGAGVHEDKIFFAHELVAGESLSAILSRRGKLAPDLAVDYASQVCDLLQCIHARDLLHAKLTPDKILIGKDGVVKVTDLRINRSRRKRWDSVTTRRELDLAAYMAPEQHEEGATVKSDLYSLGVITYEMLTGKLPYAPDTMGRMTNRKKSDPVPSAAKLVMNCPVWLDKIVSQMLQPDPRSRPHTAKAVGMALDEIKNIDKSKKAAIAQVSGNFNPLTAGSDKSEARRLLGKKKKKKRPDVPFYETIPFLVACLVLIASIITFAVWPTSTQKLFDRGVELVGSENPKDWNEGISVLKKVIRREHDQYTQPAKDHILATRRKSLIKRAMVGKKTGIQSKLEQQFIDAFQLQEDEKHQEALEAYRVLAEEYADSSKQSYILVEIRDRIERLSHSLQLPTEQDELRRLMEDIKKLTDPNDLRVARKQLVAIDDRYGEIEAYDKIVKTSQTLLEQLDEFLAELPEEPDEGSELEVDSQDSEADRPTETESDAEREGTDEKQEATSEAGTSGDEKETGSGTSERETAESDENSNTDRH